jgi:hypothetical protein
MARCRVSGAWRGSRHVLRSLALACLLVALSAPAGAALTEASRLSLVYDAILDARFDQADALLKQTCPPAPDGACQALRVVALWWQISISPDDRTSDRRFTDLAAAAIAANDAWTRREPKRAEAWFYLAGSYAPRVQWRALRGERIGAARDANRIREALERALELDPTLNDAYFGIGLYHYYADIAPVGARLLRWLLFLPGGDRVAGLREMLQARDRGELVNGEADFQLHYVFTWYEKKPADAIALLERLDAKYPNNPTFLRRIAEVLSNDLRDHRGSAAAWQLLLTRAQTRRVYAAELTEIRARAGVERETRALRASASQQ